MKKYEFVFLTKPDLEEKKLKLVFSGLEKEINKVKGKVEKKEELGKKSLVYPIADKREAFFWVWQIVFKEGKVDFSSVNTFLNREANIVRYLFLVNKGEGK